MLLACQPDYKCLSHEILIEVSDQFNISEIQPIKTPQNLSTLLEHDNQGQKKFLIFFKSFFWSHMKKGNIVYPGLAEHFFL